MQKRKDWDSNERGPISWLMSKRSPRSKLYEWRVIQLKATPDRPIGYFEVANADDAIKAAIERHEISSPHEQARLAAQRVREIAT